MKKLLSVSSLILFLASCNNVFFDIPARFQEKNISMKDFMNTQKSGVNSDGFFEHRIYLKLPRNNNRLLPELFIQFNSNGKNSIIGKGWSLKGLPVITRDSTFGINYDGTDSYVGSFGRLVNVAEPNIYHYKKEKFSQFEAVGTKGDGPAYWIKILLR